MENLNNLLWAIGGSIITSLISLYFSAINPFKVRNKGIILISWFLKPFSPFSKRTLRIDGVWEANYTNTRHPEKGGGQIMKLYQYGRLVAGKPISNEYRTKVEGIIVHDKYFFGTYLDVKDNQKYYGSFQVSYDSRKKEMGGRWIGFYTNGNDEISYGKWVWKKYKA